MKADIQQSQKIAAAISAVFGYIRSREDVDARVPPPFSAEPAAESRVQPFKPGAPVKMWGASGRQDMMHMRNLMQLRTFQGSKLR